MLQASLIEDRDVLLLELAGESVCYEEVAGNSRCVVGEIRCRAKSDCVQKTLCSDLISKLSMHEVNRAGNYQDRHIRLRYEWS